MKREEIDKKIKLLRQFAEETDYLLNVYFPMLRQIQTDAIMEKAGIKRINTPESSSKCHYEFITTN